MIPFDWREVLVRFAVNYEYRQTIPTDEVMFLIGQGFVTNESGVYVLTPDGKLEAIRVVVEAVSES